MQLERLKINIAKRIETVNYYVNLSNGITTMTKAQNNDLSAALRYHKHKVPSCFGTWPIDRDVCVNSIRGKMGDVRRLQKRVKQVDGFYKTLDPAKPEQQLGDDA